MRERERTCGERWEGNPAPQPVRLEENQENHCSEAKEWGFQEGRSDPPASSAESQVRQEQSRMHWPGHREAKWPGRWPRQPPWVRHGNLAAGNGCSTHRQRCQKGKQENGIWSILWGPTKYSDGNWMIEAWAPPASFWVLQLSYKWRRQDSMELGGCC